MHFKKKKKSVQTQKAKPFLGNQDLHILFPFYYLPGTLFIIMSPLFSYEPKNHIHLYAIWAYCHNINVLH